MYGTVTLSERGQPESLNKVSSCLLLGVSNSRVTNCSSTRSQVVVWPESVVSPALFVIVTGQAWQETAPKPPAKLFPTYSFSAQISANVGRLIIMRARMVAKTAYFLLMVVVPQKVLLLCTEGQSMPLELIAARYCANTTPFICLT